MKDLFRISISIAAVFMAACSNESDVKLEEGNIPEVVAEMTNEEKSVFLSAVPCEKIPGAVCATAKIERVGVPSVSFALLDRKMQVDSVRMGSRCLAVNPVRYPSDKALAATWNRYIARSLGEVQSREASGFGVDVLVAECGDTSVCQYLMGQLQAERISALQENGTLVCVNFPYLSTALEIALKNGRPAIASLRSKIPVDVKPLKDKWGFDGIVANWGPRMDSGKAIASGMGLILPGSKSQSDNILDSIRDTTVTQAVIDDRTASLLQMIVKTGTFQHRYFMDFCDSSYIAGVTRDLCAESFVLMENRDSALPVSVGCKVAFFGLGAFDLPKGCQTLADGFSQVGFAVNRCTEKAYRDRIADFDKRYTELPGGAVSRLAREAAKDANLAVVVVGNRETEDSFRRITDDGKLSSGEETLIRNVRSEFRHGKVAVVLRSPQQASSWKEYADAVIEAWSPSAQWSCALADVLCGNKNPSGAFPMEVSHKKTGKKGATEKIVDYPLGYGLSYSSFTLAEPEVSVIGKKMTVDVMITNNGRYDASPVVMVNDENGNLLDFAKTMPVAAGTSEKVSFTMYNKNTAVLSDDGKSLIVTLNK